jgi:hypothetical protein
VSTSIPLLSRFILRASESCANLQKKCLIFPEHLSFHKPFKCSFPKCFLLTTTDTPFHSSTRVPFAPYMPIGQRTNLWRHSARPARRPGPHGPELPRWCSHLLVEMFDVLAVYPILMWPDQSVHQLANQITPLRCHRPP